ncbi:flavoprotein [Streptacidiphilus jiangxiensis]|uniref:Flavoprotein n=1 Tax=Streptacidiphilus jiangxiensis TaxID=235985 RepID=A0A1H7H2X4_STRJI|nr:flavoprotein [Streptacidiphilus jiangxiensis]SEK44598.1 Flavoprotein [Streptacidiphilus jiangxiensis]
MTTGKPFLYIVVCAAGVADDVDQLIRYAHREGWETGLIATPNALPLIDQPALEELTGYPIRSAWRTPGQARPLPPADAIAVAPATLNTITKWAAGHADTLALGILTEAFGLGIPTAVLPYINKAQAAHPAYERSRRDLELMNVRFGSYEPHPPKAGGGRDRFDWPEAVDLLRIERTR